MKRVSLGALEKLVGTEVGVSSWTMVDQERIDRFAEVTEDFQFIHIDPARAAETPFGGTIAHGFLVLSLISKFAYEVSLEPEGTVLTVNYGLNRVRNLAPVSSGTNVRARFVLKSYDLRASTRVLMTYEIVIEAENSGKPAIVAEWLTMHELAQDVEPKR